MDKSVQLYQVTMQQMKTNTVELRMLKDKSKDYIQQLMDRFTSGKGYHNLLGDFHPDHYWYNAPIRLGPDELKSDSDGEPCFLIGPAAKYNVHMHEAFMDWFHPLHLPGIHAPSIPPAVATYICYNGRTHINKWGLPSNTSSTYPIHTQTSTLSLNTHDEDIEVQDNLTEESTAEQ